MQVNNYYIVNINMGIFEKSVWRLLNNNAYESDYCRLQIAAHGRIAQSDTSSTETGYSKLRLYMALILYTFLTDWYNY